MIGGRYLLLTINDVEPEIHGPYDGGKARDDAARQFRKEDPQKNDGIFLLDVADDGMPSVDTYSNGFFEEAAES